jgi:hypothetical protein
MQRQQWQRVMVSGILCGGALLGSCSAAPEQSATAPEAARPAASPANVAFQNQVLEGSAQSDRAQKAMASTPKVPQRKTQLIKKANLGLSVQNVEKAIQGVTRITASHQGDLLGLDDQIPKDDTTRRKATLSLRVPANQLEDALFALSKLGVTESRSIQVDDVSSQLVDFESRLRNLRKSEATVLKIMDRSGSVGDVLKVSQELGEIRNSIEQIDGQMQNLKQQVAYSTINLILEEAIAQTPQGRSLGNQLQESWAQSTHSMGVLTTRLIQLGVWILVFSPYLIGLVFIMMLGRKALARRKNFVAVATESHSSETSAS